MPHRLVVCPSCSRHVRRGESVCPFCRSELGCLPLAPDTDRRLARSALFGIGASVSLLACGDAIVVGEAPADDGGTSSGDTTASTSTVSATSTTGVGGQGGAASDGGGGFAAEGGYGGMGGDGGGPSVIAMYGMPAPPEGEIDL